MKSLLLSLVLSIAGLNLVHVFGQKTPEANTAIIDSLQNELKKNRHDSLKCKTLIEIGDVFYKLNPDTAIYFYSQCAQLAEAKGLKKTEAQATVNKGNTLRRLGNFTKAIECYLNALLIWETLENKKEIASCYSTIGKTHAIQGNYEQALTNYRKSLALSQDLKDSSAMAISYCNIGAVNSYQGNYEEAIENMSVSIGLAKKTGNNLQMSVCYNYFGNIYYFQGNFEKSIENYLNSLKISEKIGNKKEMSNCLTNIGNIQAMQQNWDKAIEYFQKALALNQEIDDKNGISACFNNLGNIYDSKGNPEMAIEFYMKSLKIAEEFGNKKQMANCYLNIGMVRANQGQYDKAIELYSKTLRIVKELGDKNGMAMIYSNISRLQINISDSSKSLSPKQRIDYLIKATEFGKQSQNIAIEIGAIPMQNESAVLLQKAYTKLGNYKEALKYAEIAIETKDSILKEEKTKALTEMETRYQSEKKQQEIEKQNLTIEKQNADISRKQAQRNLFIVGSGLLVLLVMFVFRSYLIKKKSNKIITEKNVLLSEANEEIKAQRDEIEAQRDEIEAQRDMVMEQKEHIEEIHGELTSSIRYASRIQGVMLPSTDDLNEILGNHFLLFLPRDVVSGDFYFASKVKDWIVVCVADCTGHGVPGAFMSMLGISLLNEAVHNENISQANHVLNWMRENIIHSMKQKGMEGEQKDGMDIAFCAINTKTLQMHFAGANNPCWIVRQNEENHTEPIFIELKADRMPLAIYRKLEPFTNQTFQLQKNDSIYLMSDGFEDQFGGPDGKKFMVKKLRELIIKNSGLPLDEQKNLLHNELIAWIGDQEQVDDITILGIKI